MLLLLLLLVLESDWERMNNIPTIIDSCWLFTNKKSESGLVKNRTARVVTLIAM